MKFFALLVFIAAGIFGYLYWQEHGLDFTQRADTSRGPLQDLTALPDEAQRLVDQHEMQHSTMIVTE